MSDLVFRVRRTAGGWAVEGPVWTSATMAKADALNLADGMAAAIRQVGAAARVGVEDAAKDQGRDDR